MTVRYLIGVLATVVAAQYVVIALVIVPRLARLARTQGRAVAVAQWGAAAFFIGCAVTHAGIALASLLPAGAGMAMDHPGAGGGTTGQVLGTVLPHVAQVVGGALFIGIARSRLEVSILSKSSAADQRALDRQWRSAFNDAPLGIALLPLDASTGPSGGNDSYVNRAYRDLLGHDDADTLARPLAALREAGGDDVEAAMERLARGETVVRDLRVEVDGRPRLVRATLSPVSDGVGGPVRVTGIFEDVTERADAAATLRASEERFRQMAEGLGVGVNLRQIDPPELLFANSEYLRITQLPGPDHLPGAVQTLMSRLHPDDVEAFRRDYWEPVQSGHAATFEVRLLGQDGGQRWLRLVSNPISANQVASTVEDVTPSREAVEAVRAAQAEAEQANLAKSEFLSRMSHELRTPLNAVLGFGQLLQLGSLTDKQSVAVTHILSGGRHLLGMIDDILDISRIETDQLELSVEPVRTDEVIEEAVALVRPLAAQHGVTLVVTTPDDDVPAHVTADKRRLRQVLLNLLSNAVKYNQPDGVARVSCATTADGQLAIAVSDSGIGIRDDDLERLFTPFDRLGQQTTDIEGTGIGLALSQRLATIMGGRLEVSSRHGVGSTFTVVLPVAVAPPLPAVADGTPYEEPVPDPTTTSTVLYVEDNLPNVRLMQALVDRRPDWTMVHAGHGGLGLELAASLQPELVLLDLHLPDMHGIDVLHRLRADPRTRDTRVVVVSADANQHQVQRLLDAGADDYLTKPLDVTRALTLFDDHATRGGTDARPDGSPDHAAAPTG